MSLRYARDMIMCTIAHASGLAPPISVTGATNRWPTFWEREQLPP
jgi:hypothetical protein